MNTTAWIAIAAIIIASINTWGPFWLKERSEKKKALASAKPATNQPKPLNGTTIGHLPLKRFFWTQLREYWFIYLTQFVSHASGVVLIGCLGSGLLPVNANTIALLVLVAVLAVAANYKAYYEF
jgi:hypothetical protein